MGAHCATRVYLYHSLWHYKRRLRCQLKKELKDARLFLEVLMPPAHHPDLLQIFLSLLPSKTKCSQDTWHV